MNQFKYILMKPKRNSAKVPQHKILGGEAEKLKGKLDTLKEQIRKKKEQKEMNKTSTSVYSRTSNAKYSQPTQLNSTQQSYRSKDSLLEALAQSKMEGIVEKLRQNNVTTLQDLYQISSEQIDQWKNIPVGYRIKLKKFTEQLCQRQKSNQLKVRQQNSQPQAERPSSILNIETIIQNRKSHVVFLPIEREKDEESEEEAENPLEEAEEEDMFNSILQAFRPKQRASCLHRKEEKVRKHVHWSSEIDEMERKHPHLKTYPKEKIEKDFFHLEETELPSNEDLELPPNNKKTKDFNQQIQQFPDYKYCWICLKNIKNGVLQFENRYFCSHSCMEGFEQTLKSWQVAETEKKEVFQMAKVQLSCEEEVNFDMT